MKRDPAETVKEMTPSERLADDEALKKEVMETAKEETTPWELLSFDETSRCLARVPRKFHPCLRETCKRFNTIVSSSHLYLFRKLYGTMERVILVHIVNQGWYSLCETTRGTYKLVPFWLTPIKPLSWTSSFVGNGGCVVSLGGFLDENLVVRDCRVASAETKVTSAEPFLFPALAVVDGSLYAVGLSNQSRTYRGVKIDVENSRCDLVCVAPAFVFRGLVKHKGLAIDHKMYVVRHGLRSLVFDPVLSILEEVDEEDSPLDTHLSFHHSCVIENKIFSLSSLDGHVHVYSGNSWSVLKEVQVPGNCSDITFADHNGNLLIIYKRGCDVLGTEFSIRRREEGDLIGEVIWSHALHQMETTMFQISEVVAVTI